MTTDAATHYTKHYYYHQMHFHIHYFISVLKQLYKVNRLGVILFILQMRK